MNDLGQFADNELLQLAEDGFALEADNLTQIANAPDFGRLLANVENYTEFLASGRQKHFGDRFFDDLNAQQTIDFGTRSQDLLGLKRTIDIVAACDLFAGWSLTVRDLRDGRLRDRVKRSIRDLGQSEQHAAGILARKLNSGDASRVINTLKLLGRIAPDMTNSQQLSLGASGGIRDRFSIHQIPILRHKQHNALLLDSTPETISFDVERRATSNVVLVDNDPKMRDRYRKLNEEPNVLALNLDADKAMEELARRIDTHNLPPRTFVVAFRIDHRMIPDTAGFLQHLGTVIDGTADFIVTIGAGHNNNEFRGRLEAVNDLYTSLTDRGLAPLRIKWHCGKTIGEQRSNPIFGAPTYATYEILHCKLTKSALSR